MTIIHCYTCDARLEGSGYISPAELAAQNNWLPVVIAHSAGYLCERCSKWLNHPIRICRDQRTEYFEKGQASTDQL